MIKALTSLLALALALLPTQAVAANLAIAARGARVTPNVPATAGLARISPNSLSLQTQSLGLPTLSLPKTTLHTLPQAAAPQIGVAPALSANYAPAGSALAHTAVSEAEFSPAPAPQGLFFQAGSPTKNPTRIAPIKEETAPKGLRRMVSGLRDALRLKRTADVFDGERVPGMGIVGTPNTTSDIPLDSTPEQPGETETARLTWSRSHFPGAGNINPLGALFDRSSIEPVELPGNPQTAAGIEAAIRQLIAEHPQNFGGITVDALETVLSNKVDGAQGLADTVYVNFRQTVNTLSIDGTYLDFTVKIIDGSAKLVASTAQIYPGLQVDTFGRLGDDEILSAAYERLGQPTGSYDDLRSIGRRVMHIDGRWRSVYLVLSQSKTLMAAVDVNTAETYAWDPRHQVEAGGNQVSGRGINFDPANSRELDVLSMGHIELRTSDGRKFYTDADGGFTLDGDAPVTVTARLKGRWATIKDKGRNEMSVSVEVQPGERVTLMFNPEGMNENEIAQVNAFHHTNRVHDWLKDKGINTKAIDISMPVNSNIDRDCNAYYTPWSPSLNFFSSSNRCINTAYDTVVYHEYGHFVDDVLGGIVNGALSEGWGDIIGMFMTAQPVLGEGFLKNQEKNYIRHGENTYQFRSRDEVHKQGQAWMGFGWKLRKNLVRSFGEAEGAALAEALIMPILFANVRSIPAAIEAVLMRDVGEDGTAQHFEEIAEAAASHGIELTRPSAGGVGAMRVLSERSWLQRLADATFGWLRP
jgi:hypothetical protein